MNLQDLTPLIKASETVGKVLKAGDIVIYESTVYPGCTEEDCVPVLEKFSGLKYISTGPSLRAHQPRRQRTPRHHPQKGHFRLHARARVVRPEVPATRV